MKFAHLRIGFAFFGFVLIGANSGTTAVILPSMSSYYNVNNSVIGLFFLASSAGYFLAALTSSILLERLGLRKFLIVGAAMLLLGTLTLYIKPVFSLLLITRIFLGFGYAFIETGSNAYVVALPRNTSLLNSLHAFYGAGALVGPVVAAALLGFQWGWNSVFLIWMLLSIPLLAGYALTFTKIPDAYTQSVAGNTGEAAPSLPESPPLQVKAMEHSAHRYAWVEALSLPIVWWASLFLLLYVGVEVSVGNWSYTFLVEGQHQQPFLSSWIVSGYWLGLTLGRFLLARIAERLRVSNMGLILAGAAGVILGIAIIWLWPSEVASAIGFCLVGFGLGPIYPTTVAILPQLVPSRVISSSIGFLVSLSILGIAIFPWLAGILAQLTGIWSFLPYNLGLTLLMLLLWRVLLYYTKAVKESVA